jgi:glutathione S-transferase
VRPSDNGSSSKQHFKPLLSANPEAPAHFVAESMPGLRVLEQSLTGNKWLVGGKCSAADLVFVVCVQNLQAIFGTESLDLGRQF